MKNSILLVMISFSSLVFTQSNHKGVFRTDTSKSEHIVDIQFGIAHNFIGYNYIYNFNHRLSAGARFGFRYRRPQGDIPNGYERHAINTTYTIFTNVRIWRSIYFELHGTNFLSALWPSKDNLYHEGVEFRNSHMAITSGVRCMFFEHIMLRVFYGAQFNFTSKNWNNTPTFSLGLGYKF